MILVQIVTGIPDGIGDYALQLARQLRMRHGIETSFIIGDPDWSGGDVEGFAVTKISARTEQALLRAIADIRGAKAGERLEIFLHASPYGYAKRGCPLWLANVAEECNRAAPGTFHVAFHELSVTGAVPWSSAFWVAPLQKRISVRLARAARFRYTNTEDHRTKLEIWGAGRTALEMNCATIIEPRLNPPFAERRKSIVVFGRPDHRRHAYERGRAALEYLCASIQAESIVDIGMPIPGSHFTHLAGVPVERFGRLESGEVGAQMAKAVASFTYYPVTALGKSSVYHVSCSHGTVPFIFDDQANPRSCPGLIVGEHFVPLPSHPSDSPRHSLEHLSQMVFDKYQERASWALADKVAKAIQ